MNTNNSSSVWYSSAQEWENFFYDILVSELSSWLIKLMKEAKSKCVLVSKNYYSDVYRAFCYLSRTPSDRELIWEECDLPIHISNMKKSFRDLPGILSIVLKNKFLLLSYCRINNFKNVGLEQIVLEDFLHKVWVHVGCEIAPACCDLVWNPNFDLSLFNEENPSNNERIMKSKRKLMKEIRKGIDNIIMKFLPLEKLTENFQPKYAEEDLEEAKAVTDMEYLNVAPTKEENLGAKTPSKIVRNPSLGTPQYPKEAYKSLNSVQKGASSLMNQSAFRKMSESRKMPEITKLEQEEQGPEISFIENNY